MHCREDGFKAQVAVEPDTGMVTACALSKAIGVDGYDATVGVALLDRNRAASARARRTPPMAPETPGRRWPAAWHIAFIKAIPVRPPVPGGFTVDDFAIDHDARTVTCPGGLTRPITPARAPRVRRCLH